MSPLCNAASTTTGMCVMITTTLNRIVAGRKRASQRTDRRSLGGESSTRAIQVGVPSSSSGAASIEYTRCWTMCTENRYPSPRSWMGQSEATNNASRPDEKQTTCSGVTTAVFDRRETGTDPDDGDRVGRAQQPDEEPHLRMRLERGEGNRSHS